MKRLISALTIGVTCWASCFTASALAEDGIAFFRVVSPTAVEITALSSDGVLTWSNASPGATCVVQRADSLVGQNVWRDYMRVTTTGPHTSVQLFATQPPPGMVFIPGGIFTMGDSFGEGEFGEVPLHEVTLSPFYLGRYEVTKSLWDEVAAWANNHGYDIEPDDTRGKGPDHPVALVTWLEAVKWCNARSEREGLSPCYWLRLEVFRSGGFPLPAGDLVCNWEVGGYRLPTEAEWELAARGGAEGHRFAWSDTDTIQHSRANYRSSDAYSYDTSATRGYHPTYYDGAHPYSSPVGSFATNGYGLYDMTGNIMEWCWDIYYSLYYDDSPSHDPRGPKYGTERVLRGGNYAAEAHYCRVAHRGANSYGWGGMSSGFRLAQNGPAIVSP